MALHLVTGYSGKAHITSADQGALNAATFGRGNYVLNVGNQFAARVITNNSINVLDGEVIMQGRHIRLESGAYEEVTIENGAQGYFRNDLICIRYTKDSTTGIEEAALVVIKGNPDASAAVDPAHNNGSILDGILTVDFPLYRVPLNGLNIGDLVALFEAKGSLDERINAVLNGTTPAGNANKLGGKGASEYALQITVDNIQTTSRATLSTAGWYRVAECDGGHNGSLFLRIGNMYADGGCEEHTVLFNNSQSHVEFIPISCKGIASRVFTKVRYTRYSSKRYLEVYYALNVANPCGFSIFGQESTASGMFQTITPVATSETVSGVTVTTTYDIPANASPVTDLDLANYLPLSGGTVGYYGRKIMTVKSLDGNASSIGFEGQNGLLGELGISDITTERVPFFKDNDGTTRKVLHEGNYGDYALPLTSPTAPEVKVNSSVTHTTRSTTGNANYFHLYGKDSDLGYLGFYAQNTPAFLTTGGVARQLLHTGNSAKVAIQSTAPTDTSALWVW